MNTLQKIDHWSLNHRSNWFDYIRIILGLVVFYKGILFTADVEGLRQIIISSRSPFTALFLEHYAIFAQLAGGLLIALGLKTRVAIAFQIPILLGEIIFANAETGFFSVGPALALSLILLVTLSFYLFYGSGRVSIDRYMQTHKNW